MPRKCTNLQESIRLHNPHNGVSHEEICTAHTDQERESRNDEDCCLVHLHAVADDGEPPGSPRTERPVDGEREQETAPVPHASEAGREEALNAQPPDIYGCSGGFF